MEDQVEIARGVIAGLKDRARGGDLVLEFERRGIPNSQARAILWHLVDLGELELAGRYVIPPRLKTVDGISSDNRSNRGN